ncbi:hypothetical protein TOI97_07385 [Denitrificimonas sp. JX-1]|uniref:SecDF P1 head subdomain domain-containing protein n=1 Tax=Denitrificimonas halotolerans TaxID=3098930 RepID=A0ABU5GRC1_9GAMM|nr:hypothetical protein [Denitrificimonas sp. JX-1]MDY7219389.1 hypothetical protein [Denitrificimonas sp. JX-1]
MLTKMPFKLAGLALGLALIAGCQTTGEQQAAATPTPAQTAEQASQQATQNVFTVHLAQQEANPELLTLDLGENTKLYAAPQPVLTQADMVSVAPVQAEDGQTFLLFEMTEAGKKKLAELTKKSVGKFFLFSARNQLVSVAKIDEPVTSGTLLMATQNEAHTAQIMQQLR